LHPVNGRIAAIIAGRCLRRWMRIDFEADSACPSAVRAHLAGSSRATRKPASVVD